jgi:hypothetical protein
MDHGERTSAAEGAETRIAITAHHEAGHILAAATGGIKLRPEGIMVDTDGVGFACYCKEPDDSDLSRERVIVSTFAGRVAQERLCKEHSYPPAGYFEIIWSPDWREARGVILKLSSKYISGRGLEDVQRVLEENTAQLIERNWNTVERIASTLLSKDWKPVKPLKSGGQWSNETRAKYLPGWEIVMLLEDCGIAASCVSEC